MIRRKLSNGSILIIEDDTATEEEIELRIQVAEEELVELTAIREGIYVDKRPTGAGTIDDAKPRGRKKSPRA